MYEGLQSKRTLLLAFLWILFAIFLLFNVGMVTIGLSLSTGAIIQPVGNLIIIGLWVLLKSAYNDANAKLNHLLHVESLQKENAAQIQYGETHHKDYVPHITLSEALFQHIEESANEGSVLLDQTIAEYMSPGRQLILHSETDYGYLRRIEVLDAKSTKKGILTHYKKM